MGYAPQRRVQTVLTPVWESRRQLVHHEVWRRCLLEIVKAEALGFPWVCFSGDFGTFLTFLSWFFLSFPVRFDLFCGFPIREMLDHVHLPEDNKTPRAAWCWKEGERDSSIRLRTLTTFRRMAKSQTKGNKEPELHPKTTGTMKQKLISFPKNGAADELQ